MFARHGIVAAKGRKGQKEDFFEGRSLAVRDATQPNQIGAPQLGFPLRSLRPFAAKVHHENVTLGNFFCTAAFCFGHSCAFQCGQSQVLVRRLPSGVQSQSFTGTAPSQTSG